MGDLFLRTLVSQLLPRCLQTIPERSRTASDAPPFCVPEGSFGLTNRGRYNNAR